MPKLADYKRAVEILLAGEYNEKEICAVLAKERPDLFCKYAGMKGQTIEEKIIVVGVRDGKIHAIKEHRMLTGFGLKESKDYVEQLFDKRGLKFRGME